MADEPLREIQLNGKQLVFLFMSATVVAVVVFLSGVMVGRGVQPSERVGAGLVDAPLDPTVDPTLEQIGSSAGTASAASPELPVTMGEKLDYGDVLGEDETAADDLMPPSEPMPQSPARLAEPTPAPRPTPNPVPTVVPAAARPAQPVRRATTAPAQTPASSSARTGGESRRSPVAGEPPGTGFVVQVIATPERSEADAVARRLANKGYPAFVTTTATGPRMFRVRVGKYDQRREAVSVAARLEREEQFKPWVTD